MAAETGEDSMIETTAQTQEQRYARIYSCNCVIDIRGPEFNLVQGLYSSRHQSFEEALLAAEARIAETW
jgi:hypothetical protein